ncbi:MSCRAMM family protein [Companilactobacillus baiquanensis]|uniref:Collagen binding domain-containing protein n=1 Tax=Companilactobacillus baiquanensis TaxID=2486005 RepID=A0ABW1V0J4_9LACO|nr:SpaA isopeptide-forming pilin-related protein [Companilactobacillus baiquanensis]
MNRIKKDRVTALIMLFVFGVSLVGNLFNASSIQADTTSGDDWKTPQTVILDGSGTEDITNIANLSGYTSLTANFHWDIPDDATITDGEVLKFKIPDNVQLDFDKSGSDQVKESAFGKVVIPYDTREGTVTLNDYFTQPAHNTNRHIDLSFSGKGINNSGEDPDPDPGDKAFMVKTGWSNGDSTTIPTKITWQTVLNQNVKTVSGLVVTDKIGDGQKLDRDSLTIRDSHNNDIQGVDISYTDDGFTLNFTKPITDKIDIIYNTDITSTVNFNDIYSWTNYIESSYTGISADTGGDPVTVPGDPVTNHTPTAIVNWGSSLGGSGYNGSVVLKKVDKTTGASLQGAVFSLVKSDGSTVNDAEGNPEYQNLTTDSNGQIAVSNLRAGDYKFIERTAPDGYLLNSDNEHEFQITTSQQLPIEFDVTNQRDPSTIKGNVVLNKTASDTGKPLAGAIFDLQKSDGTSVAKGLSTNDDGQIIYSNLPVGDYQFVETTAPTGYDINKTKLGFTISDSQTQPNLTMVDKKTSDTSNPGTNVPDTTGKVILTKSDAETKSVLQGAVFKLENSDGKVLKNNLTTDSAGQITIDNLAFGKYQFVETKAPDNYVLNQTPIPFDLKSGTVNVSATNNKKADVIVPVDPTNPVDPGNPNDPEPTIPDPVTPLTPRDSVNQTPSLPTDPDFVKNGTGVNNPSLPQYSKTSSNNSAVNKQAKLPQTSSIRSTFAAVAGSMLLFLIALEVFTKYRKL